MIHCGWGRTTIHYFSGKRSHFLIIVLCSKGTSLMRPLPQEQVSQAGAGAAAVGHPFCFTWDLRGLELKLLFNYLLAFFSKIGGSEFFTFEDKINLFREDKVFYWKKIATTTSHPCNVIKKKKLDQGLQGSRFLPGNGILGVCTGCSLKVPNLSSSRSFPSQHLTPWAHPSPARPERISFPIMGYRDVLSAPLLVGHCG